MLSGEYLKRYLVNNQHFGFQARVISLAGYGVCASPVDLACRISRRCLLDAAGEFCKRLLHCLAGDMFRGISGIDRCLQVKRRSGSTQSDFSGVDFAAGLQLIDTPGGLSAAYQHHTRGKRVKSACMADFELAHAQRPEARQQRSAQFLNHVKRRPAKRLVDHEYVSVNRIYHNCCLIFRDIPKGCR